MATLLSLVGEVCGTLGITVPTAVYSSADTQIIQMRRLLERSLDALSERGSWQELTVEASLVTLAAEDQGDITSIATNGYRYALGDTFWDRTNKIPLVGPMAPIDWQALKAWIVTGPRYQFRLRQNKLLVTPAPAAGYDWRFEYISENTIRATGAAPYTYKKRFTDDADVILLPDNIVTADLLWRWKKEKGAAFAQDFDTAEAMIVNAIGRSGGQKATLYLDNGAEARGPGISVPLFTNITRP